MVGSYNMMLVFASYCVAVVASFSAIYFGSRVFELDGGARKFWLGAGAVCLGSGIWSMHFVGMSAYQMPMGMEMSFNAAYTLASWIPAVLASCLALYVITLPEVSYKSIAASSVIMGTGIFAMHYGGMAAMQMTPAIQYDVALVIVSGVIAVAASGAALVICRKVRDVPRQYALAVKIGAALVMGIAICGMHYTGMAAASYPMGAQAAVENSLRGDWMGYPAALVAGVFLLIAIYIAYSDFREMERIKAEVAKKEQAIAYAAFFDAETGLGNRSLLERQVLDKLMVEGQSEKAQPFRLYYIEISNYKDLVSQQGEAVAKVFTEQFVSALQSLKGVEELTRYSANSFVAIVPVVEGHKASEFIKPLISAFKRGLVVDKQSVPCDWALGCSEFPKSGSNSRNLIRAAQKIQQRFPSVTAAEVA
ncbi:bifunctional diguanylate cyclase/phosphodiesterase [Pseudomaricurvus sp.]|uniref:MHYT domain-containing protein n=1 Tax=Pseudomaricurvus sp. TaxID=2004510 RepID=UPI003F6CFA3A